MFIAVVGLVGVLVGAFLGHVYRVVQWRYERRHESFVALLRSLESAMDEATSLSNQLPQAQTDDQLRRQIIDRCRSRFADLNAAAAEASMIGSRAMASHVESLRKAGADSMLNNVMSAAIDRRYISEDAWAEAMKEHVGPAILTAQRDFTEHARKDLGGRWL